MDFRNSFDGLYGDDAFKVAEGKQLDITKKPEDQIQNLIEGGLESSKAEVGDEDEQEKLGNLLIKLLGLRVKSNGRVDTSWGDKTPLGLYLTVKRIYDGDIPKEKVEEV